MISLVNALAKHYGWGERYIVWELPYWRALMYYHSILYSEGVWTVDPPEVSSESLDISWLKSTKAPQTTDDDDLFGIIC